MKQFQLKEPQVVNVLGLSYEGDYIIALNGSQYAVVAKSTFEATYVPVPEAAAAPVEQPATLGADQPKAEPTAADVPNAQHAV